VTSGTSAASEAPMNDDRELRNTFLHYDEDGNGTIEFSEFAHLLTALGAEMDEDEMRMGFDIIDVDHDGHVDFSEFSAWWSSR
jgi:Ca2+-binding EF-hand superfamily protein